MIILIIKISLRRPSSISIYIWYMEYLDWQNIRAIQINVYSQHTQVWTLLQNKCIDVVYSAGVVGPYKTVFRQHALLQDWMKIILRRELTA